jgi:hypothetical protein
MYSLVMLLRVIYAANLRSRESAESEGASDRERSGSWQQIQAHEAPGNEEGAGPAVDLKEVYCDNGFTSLFDPTKS